MQNHGQPYMYIVTQYKTIHALQYLLVHSGITSQYFVVKILNMNIKIFLRIKHHLVTSEKIWWERVTFQLILFYFIFAKMQSLLCWNFVQSDVSELKSKYDAKYYIAKKIRFIFAKLFVSKFPIVSIQMFFVLSYLPWMTNYF